MATPPKHTGLRALALLPGKVYRNRDLIQNLAEAAMTVDGGVRKERFRHAFALVWQKVFEGETPANLDHAKGKAKALLEKWPWVRSHLKALPHFGVLQVLVQPMSPTRLDYVAIQLKLALELKESARGLGLSSPLKLHNQVTMTGLELLQMWSILLSAGHLFGTFATARALAYRLRREPRSTQMFLDQIHTPARETAERTVTAGTMNEINSAVAAWRVSVDLAAGSTRNRALAALAAYSAPPTTPPIARLKALHQRVRQVAAQRLQGTCAFGLQYTHLLPEVASLAMTARLERVIEEPGIAFDPELLSGSPYSRLLSAIDDYQESELFNSFTANSLVLEHIRRFKWWWHACNQAGEPLEDRLRRLCLPPRDWPSAPDAPLFPALRFDLPPQSQPERWVQDVLDWIGDRDGEPWGTSNFLISQTRSGTIVDIFTQREGAPISPTAACHVARRLAATEKSAGRSTLLGRSVSRFAQMLLGYIIKAPHTTFLTPSQGDATRSLCLISSDLDDLTLQVSEFSSGAKDEGRRSEISAVSSALRTLGLPTPEAWLMLTSRLEIFTESSPDCLGEIDGAVAMFFPDRVTWLFFEVKESVASGATTQLEAVGRLFNGSSQVSLEKYSSKPIARICISWPPEP